MLPGRPSMRQPIRAVVTGFGERRDIASISLNAPALVAVHRSIVRIGDDHFVPQLLEVLGDPFTLGRRLQQNAHPWPAPKYLCEAIARGRDALVNDLPTLGHDTNLTFLLVEVDGTIVHGWSPLLRLERVFAMWSGSYHLTKGTSRFILSVGISRSPARFPSSCGNRSVISTGVSFPQPCGAANLSSPPPQVARWRIPEPGPADDRRSWGILSGRFSRRSASRSTIAPFPHPIAFALRRDHRRVMGQTVEQRGREFFIAGEDGHPFGKREVGRDHRCAALVPVGDQIEEQLAADALERDKAELVDDKHVEPQQPLLEPCELAGIAGFKQLAN